MFVDFNDYPYMCTYCDSIEEADQVNKYGMTGWHYWNGIAMTWPKFVRYKGKTYTFEEFKKEVWKR